jgi:hypothetical protein
MEPLHKLLMLRLGCERAALDGILDAATIDAAIASGEISEIDGKLYVDIPNEAVGIASAREYAQVSMRSRRQRTPTEFIYKPSHKGDHYRS